jgi:hypothetical protein
MHARPTGLPIAIAAGAALLMAGCGTSDSAASNPITASSTPAVSAAPSPPVASASSHPARPGKFNSCSIVTQAEAASALGSKVSAGVLGTATVEGGLACVFFGPAAPATQDADLAQPDTVRVVLVKGASALKWYNNYRSRVPARAVSGYGDKAFFDGGSSLSVLKGRDYLRVAVVPKGAAPSLADEKTLAAAILSNL